MKYGNQIAAFGVSVLLCALCGSAQTGENRQMNDQYKVLEGIWVEEHPDAASIYRDSGGILPDPQIHIDSVGQDFRVGAWDVGSALCYGDVYIVREGQTLKLFSRKWNVLLEIRVANENKLKVVRSYLTETLIHLTGKNLIRMESKTGSHLEHPCNDQ